MFSAPLLTALLIFLGALGFLGILGMTWLFPVIGQLIRGRVTRHGMVEANTPEAKGMVGTLAVLIPVHNEAHHLAACLDSISESLSQLRAAFPGVHVLIRIGADGCSDESAQIARSYGAEVIEFASNQGKWTTLQRLIDISRDADWVALADAGVRWSSELCTRVVPVISQTDVAAVAPTYRNPAAGWTESVVWGFERHFKKLESNSGGPVSIHGATVFYKHSALIRAYEWLRSAERKQPGLPNQWLNDDVVLPLLVRTLNPSKRIAYLPWLSVADSDLSRQQTATARASQKPDFGRRRRMVQGNLQWIRWVLPAVWSDHKAVAILAMRRVFRLFWAYWAMFAYCGILGAAMQIGLPSAVIWVIALSPLVVLFSRLRGAVFASLLAPYYLGRHNAEMKWN